jgi:hypothetical protein
LNKRLSRVSTRGIIAIAVGLIATLALAPTLASGAGDLGSANTVFIKADKGGLRFEAPKTIVAGEELEVLNQTNAKQVGPHTFSLVTKGSIPKTANARKNCFTPKHICLAIAKWHGFDPKTEKISINPAKAGPEGWSTMGNATGKKGDSWFTGEKPGGHFEQVVSAPAGTVLYFQCAVHPWMHGKVTVAPAPVPTA